MRYEFKLALRYFTSGRKNLVRFTSGAAIIGIGAGVACLVITQAITNGFRSEIQDKILSNTAHITVSEDGDLRVSNWKIIEKTILEHKDVLKVEPTHYESTIISNNGKLSHAIIRIKTWKTKPPKENTELVKVAVGIELAKKTGLKIGDEFNLLAFNGEEKAQNADAKVEKIFETGLLEYDTIWIYISETDYLKLKEINRFTPSIYNVFINDIFQANQVGDELKKVLGSGFKIASWQETNKTLFSALSLERKAAFAVFILIIFIAALNITTTLSLLVNERKYDIGVLRTCGANTKSIVLVFFYEGFILSSLGIIIGLVLGLSVCFAGNYFRLISISQEVYSLNYVPFAVNYKELLGLIIAVLLVCFSAMIYPVIKAERIKPINNLKTY